jgi:hypothetical protein
MSGSVDPSRRHGRFDLRWPARPLRGAADWRAPAPVGLGDVPDGLDWEAFSTRYFPGRRRHDLEAISAYDAYTHGPTVAEGSRPEAEKAVDRLEAERYGGSAAGAAAGRARVLEPVRRDPMTATRAVVVEPVESAEPTIRSAQEVTASVP